ncbi:hypothetical protein JG687_00004426 [Phytophthora cactorum]|uniref:Uncharacterized protein n=1 Tax=Phytophthora cactorum TaxID=29920 RepID=A0A8T1UT64_9STRA|nr:hypothetical protein JG687_00004426 [Phytophthora cactorum]
MEPDLITVDLGINVDDSLGEEAFLKTLEETLQQHVASLGQQFLVLSATQVDRLAFRLNDALVPKRDAETHVIQAWTIQPQLQLKVKASAHIQVLKLSTILREVQKLRLHQSQTEEAQNPIEVEIFPSLRVIEVLNTKTRGLQNVHYFANQLREFHIEHTEVTTLRRLLAPTKEEQKPWRKLLKLQMNCCELQILDDSVNLLRAVKTLDLGWNKIEKVETDVTTKSLQVLNLCHNQLRHVPSIQSLRSLRELDLAVNQISSLKGLETLTALERLDVSHNLIEDIAEVELLTSLPRLTYLKMEFNPIARRPDYRREVLFYLGEPIELDGKRWSDAESRELIERFTVSDDKDPIAITRWLPSVVAVGTSMHSSRAKIITMKLRPRGSSSVADAAYQFDAVASLGTLLTPLVARLYQQYKGHIMICNCANCGALSLLTPKYPARTEADEMLMVYSCLLCSSCNVRETSFKKLIALCANEGVTIPSSIPLAPPPWETITEGFYIEEPAATDPSSMRECVMVSCNGIREVATPTAELGRNDETHSNELNDAIVHAMTATMR